MKRFTLASLITVPALLLTSVGAAAQGTQTLNAQRALQWLQCTQQQPSGQIGPNADNPVARSAELVIGLAAAGQDPSAFQHNGFSVADYLKSAVSTDVGTNGTLLMARALEPGTGSTATVVAQLTAAEALTGPSAGEYGGDIFSDALAILGLHAAKQSIDANAVRFLRSKQDADKGWSFDNAQSGSDSNTTALVLQALIAGGVTPDDSAITNGLDYLKTQFQNGGFVFSTQYGTTPDAQSDDLAIEALLAANVATSDAWSASLGSAQSNLASLQIASGPDGGALAGFDKLMATTPAVGAFLLQPLTATAARESQLALLSCPAAVVASTAATPATRLPQTGGAAGLPLRPVVFALALFLAAGALLRRRTN
ncbi:MAG TPA: hypothetical protein VIO62_17710 [Candidatus Dormibacteraeota bacterium]|jgi:hypothetical protein